MSKVLITADWHVRGDRPRCRVDEDWIESQRQDIANIRKVYDDNGCDTMWILGDVFDQPRCATEAVNMVLGELQKFSGDVRILCGNHDLPYHDYDNLERCSLGILLKSFPEIGCGHHARIDKVVSANPFGRDDLGADADVVCTHQLTFPSDEARPIAGIGKTAQELLDTWRDAEVIFTGDYHHGYVYKEDWDTLPARWVVTPGCINIQKADMADYEPFVVIWDTADNTFVKEYLEPHYDMVVTDYLVTQKEREERIEKCVQVAQGFDSVDLDFISSLQEATESQSEGVKSIINEVVDTLNKNK